MADPDAVKLGYLRQQQVKVGKTTKTVYSNKKQGGGTYAPSSTQAPEAYQAYQASSQAYQASRKARQAGRQLKKAKQNPQGDVDGDGVPNNIDNNNLVKDNLTPESRTINKETKAQAERREGLNARIQAALTAAQASTPLPPTWLDPLSNNTTLPKAKVVDGPGGTKLVYALEKNNKGQSSWVFSKVEVDGKSYTEQVRNPKRIDNPNYNKKLDVDNDGVSGTRKDYTLLSKQKAREDRETEGPVDDTTTGTTVTGGTTTTPGDSSPSSSPNRNRSAENRRNASDGRNSSRNNENNNNNNNNHQTGGNTLMKDPNGNNLLARFTKVYGEEGKAKLREALDAFKAAGGDFNENYQIGQYGYNVTLKLDGKEVTDPDVIKEKLVAHASASSAMSSQYADPASAQALTRLQLFGVTGGGTEKGLTRRFALAYGGGDTTKGNQILTAAIAAYEKAKPNNIQVHGTPGQPGAYVQVMHNGEWTSNSDIVSKKLASYVGGEDGQTKPFKELSKAQQAFLGGANGSAVLNRYNLAFNATGTEAFQNAVDRYEKLNPGNDIKVHGKPGEQGFWVEVKTKDGWSSDTDAVLKRLSKDSRPAGVSTAGENTPGTPGASQVPANSNGQPGTETVRQRPDRQGRPSGQDRSSGAGGHDVSISEAAQKSQVLMAADLNADGTVSKKEQTVLNAADRNKDGVVGVKEAEKFVAVADVDKSGTVERTEAKAYKMVDSNDNGKISKKELKAFKSIAGKDGEISRKEAKQALKAQIDSKQDQREHDLAVEYLKKTSNKTGGSQDVSEQAAALVNAQQNKPKKQDNDGPGKKKKK